MTVDNPPNHAEHSDPAISEDALVEAEFSLLRHASNYDLANPDERLRSHKDLERLFHSLMLVLKPDVFIECGAFFAEASRKVKHAFPKTRVVAFEANPYNYEKCRQRVDYDKAGIEYIHSALSSERGEVTFKVQATRDGKDLAKTTGRSSLFERNDAILTFESVTVPATTLDYFFTPLPSKSVLWIDVEGAAGLVLRGGAELLETTDMVFIEVEDKPLWDGQWLTRDVTRFLSRYGLVPIARDFESPSRIQYNMLFIKNRHRTNRQVWRFFSEYHSYCSHPNSKLISTQA
jgi:FkbM family methyltransferase